MPQEKPGGSFGAWPFVLAVFAFSRLFFFAVGAAFVGLLPAHPYHRTTLDDPFGTLSMWAHYDGARYVVLAGWGYAEGSPAFFPLYPLLVRLAAELWPGPLSVGVLSWAGVAVSLAALPIALWFVYRIAEKDLGVRAARATVVLLAFFPTAFFLNSAYTESLFLALSAGSVWAARVRKDLALACALAGLAAATRHVGVFLLVPLLFEWWQNRERWSIAWLALVPSGLLAYAGFLWARFGDPLLFLAAQSEWNRGLTAPLDALHSSAAMAVEGLWPFFDWATYRTPQGFLLALTGANQLYNYLFLVFVVVALGVRLPPMGLTLYALALILFPVLVGAADNPLVSTPRFVLAAFPVFMGVGALLEDRRLLVAWTLASALASLPFVALFVNWYFVA